MNYFILAYFTASNFVAVDVNMKKSSFSVWNWRKRLLLANYIIYFSEKTIYFSKETYGLLIKFLLYTAWVRRSCYYVGCLQNDDTNTMNFLVVRKSRENIFQSNSHSLLNGVRISAFITKHSIIENPSFLALLFL